MAPPSAMVATAVELSLKMAMVPVLVLLLTTKVLAEPEVRLVTVVAPCSATVPAMVEPMVTFVV